MTDFYTDVQVYGSSILYRGIENGKRIQRRIKYSPTLYVRSDDATKYQTIHGEYLKPMDFDTMREAKDFISQYKDVENFDIYGNNRFEYCFITESFPDQIEWNKDRLRIANIDIEVNSENGRERATDAKNATEEVTAIGMKIDGYYHVWSDVEYQNHADNVTYYKCHNELDILNRFLDFWSRDHPDIITGWHVNGYDVPYLVNRITNLLGEAQAKRLSPWGQIRERSFSTFNQETQVYTLVGITILDYMDLYKKFAPRGQSQESYRLDNIAHVELGERKLDYSEAGQLHHLKRDNPQKFIEYNIQDIGLVDRLEDKLRLIELVLTLAYIVKCNIGDVFTQVRMWDTIIYNHLLAKNVIVPPASSHRKDAPYIGAYVKDPIIGRHNWVASFDLNSLYPHLIMQFNISPDTFIEPIHWTDAMKSVRGQDVTIDKLLEQKIDTEPLKVDNAILTPNGHFFDKSKLGFLPELMQTLYDARSANKRKMLDAMSAKEQETDPVKKAELNNRIARYNNLQLAMKVTLNSAYGALGNQYFRFFDVRQASAITTSGQLVIRWIANDLNKYLNNLLKTGDKDYVIASDTDSVYLSFEQLVNKVYSGEHKSPETESVITFLDKVCQNKIEPFIDKSYDRLGDYLNVYAQKMKMKREVLADKAIWTAKKRYLLNVYDSEGVRYAKPKLKISGLEAVKSSTPMPCREKIYEVLQIILSGTEKEVIQFIDDFREEFRTLAPEDIAFPRGISNMGKFSDPKMVYGSGTPIHVRGALLYNHWLDKKNLGNEYERIKEGEKIKFIYLREPNPIQSNVISFLHTLPKELDIEKYIDYNVQYDKAFVEPLKIILDCIGWKTEHVDSLEAFFS